MGMTRAFHAGSLDHENTSDRRSNAESDGAGDTAAIASPSPQGKTPAGGGSGDSSKPLSSSGLGHPPFTRAARIRIPYGVPTEKTCSGCHEALPLASFNKDRTRKDGLQTSCRDCKKRYQTTDEQRRKSNERGARYREANPEAKKAHRKLGYAIDSGKMIRGFCECCGTEKADAHHWKGYDHPLDVQWLCRSCHVTLEPRRGVAA